MEAKYIIIDKTKPIIFSPAIMHSDEANGRNVTSAGFVSIWADGEVAQGEEPLTIHCYGESVSLNDLKSKPVTDAKLIRAML